VITQQNRKRAELQILHKQRNNIKRKEKNMTTKDPYMLDASVGQSLIDANKIVNKGIICPKHNLMINKPCAVCTQVKALYDAETKEKRELAGKLSAKPNYYAYVVFPSNPDKAVFLKMGKKAGDMIKYGINMKGWLDIVNPKKGVGREIKITKFSGDGQRNAYSVEPSLEKLTYDVGKAALDGRKNFDDRLSLIETEEIFKITSLKIDETITVMLLPDLDLERKWPIASVWEHWGVTQDEIDGKIPVQLLSTLSTQVPPGSQPLPEELIEPLPWDAVEGSPERGQQVEPPIKVEPNPSAAEHEGCYKDKDSFEIDDKEVCQKCADFIKCGVACGFDEEELKKIKNPPPKKAKKAKV